MSDWDNWESYQNVEYPQRRKFRDRFGANEDAFGAAEAEDLYDDSSADDMSFEQHAAGLDRDLGYEQRFADRQSYNQDWHSAPLPPAQPGWNQQAPPQPDWNQQAPPQPDWNQQAPPAQPGWNQQAPPQPDWNQQAPPAQPGWNQQAPPAQPGWNQQAPPAQPGWNQQAPPQPDWNQQAPPAQPGWNQQAPPQPDWNQQAPPAQPDWNQQAPPAQPGWNQQVPPAQPDWQPDGVSLRAQEFQQRLNRSRSLAAEVSTSPQDASRDQAKPKLSRFPCSNAVMVLLFLLISVLACVAMAFLAAGSLIRHLGL